MIGVIALLGAGIGLGVWMMFRAVRPRVEPLGAALAALDRTAAIDPTEYVRGDTLERRAGGAARRLVRTLGTDLDDYGVDLRILDRSPARHALDKIIGAVGGMAAPLLVWGGLGVVGIRLPVVGVLGLSAGAAIGGWILPDLTLREQAARRRKAFRHALSSYLDLVNVIIAGGGGIQTALYTAADAGDGWAFAAIRRALDRARLTQRSPWDTFADLSEELDVPELAELAAAVALAGSQGARIRSSLAAKADTLRGHQVAETEAAAESATERMTIPVAVLLFGFLVFVAYPAVQQITTVSGPAGP
ncbi:MAG: type II secretion system F family protein [Acidimicrobiales bacterium]|nr:type II secretion system F family protein [Acidimicrobiales bacterium]